MSASVLVVDDDAEICSLVSDLLRNSGYDVVTAANGNEALSRLRRGRTDVIVTDLWMPGMDGWDLLAEIAKTPALSGMRMIVYSATSNPCARFLPQGVTVILKPEVGGLFEAVEQKAAEVARLSVAAPPRKPYGGEQRNADREHPRTGPRARGNCTALS